MNTAEEFMQTYLGGNMNIATLKPKAISEMLEDYSNLQLAKELQWLRDVNEEAMKQLKERDETIEGLRNEIRQWKNEYYDKIW